MPPKKAPSKSAKDKKGVKDASKDGGVVIDSTNAAMVDGVNAPPSFREMELEKQLSFSWLISPLSVGKCLQSCYS